jgi:hypothetical protein
MNQKAMFQDVSPAELRAVEGGLSLSGLVNALKSVGNYFLDKVVPLVPAILGRFFGGGPIRPL